MIPGIVASTAGIVAQDGGGVGGNETSFDWFSEVYLVDGETIADVTTQIGSGSWFGPFNDAQIENGVGLKSPVEGQWLAETLAVLLAGFTVVIELTWEDIGAAPAVEFWMFDDASFSTGHFIDVGISTSQLGDFSTTQNSDLLAEGSNKIAATFEANNIALSVNGSAAVSISNPTISAPIDAAALSVSGTSAAIKIQKITFIAPVANGELAALSDLGSA